MAFFSYLNENSDITDITFNDRPRLGPIDKASTVSKATTQSTNLEGSTSQRMALVSLGLLDSLRIPLKKVNSKSCRN